jgi:hypothetical protein
MAFVARASGRLNVTDLLAMSVLYARIAQSIIHLASTSVPAVLLRANLLAARANAHGARRDAWHAYIRCERPFVEEERVSDSAERSPGDRRLDARGDPAQAVTG